MLVEHDVNLRRAVSAGVPTHSGVGLEFCLRHEMVISAAFRVVRQTLMAAVLENLSILGAGCTRDGLHQSGVSVRRSRAIFSLVKSTSLGVRMQTVRAELKWLSDLLGNPREYDVVLKRILRPIAAENPDTSGFQALLRSFRMLQQGTRAALLTGLRMSRITQLGIELDKGLHRASREELAGFGAEFVDQERLSAFVAAALQSRLQALVAAGAECVRHDVKALSLAQVALDSLARQGEPFTEARLLPSAIGRIR